jgi:hypothetical protein
MGRRNNGQSLRARLWDVDRDPGTRRVCIWGDPLPATERRVGIAFAAGDARSDGQSQPDGVSVDSGCRRNPLCRGSR